MRKLKKNLISVVVIIFILFGLKQIIPVLKLDGYLGLLLSILLLTDDTKYSADYSDWKFLKIKKGMNRNQVYELIGKPIDVFSPTCTSSN